MVATIKLGTARGLVLLDLLRRHNVQIVVEVVDMLISLIRQELTPGIIR